MKGTNDTILAIVCGNVLYGNEVIPEFLGVTVVPKAANSDGAEDALLDIAWQTEMTGRDFAEKYDGVLIYFYTVKPDGYLSMLGTIGLKTVEIRRILEVGGGEEDKDEQDDVAHLLNGEPRPITWGDLEPFAPDDLDIYAEPETWD